MKNRTMKRISPLLSITLAVSLLAGCTAVDKQQRSSIFEPDNRTWPISAELASQFKDVWINYDSTVTGQPAQLHGLWLPAAAKQPGWSGAAQAPLLLFLHGAHWNVTASTERMQHMQKLGFSVLAIDYRGFGKSTPGLPSEAMAYEDTRAAWNWLGAQHPGQPRYIFGHSLGGAMAIELASQVNNEAGTIVECTFTSAADVFAATSEWGWLPMDALMTQPFASVDKVARVGAPLLVVHGTKDTRVPFPLGQKLYAAAVQPKTFVQIDGGTHEGTNALADAQYKVALRQLFASGQAAQR
jgi:alpha-beta hydrolase superfamily lysophospholipase